MLKENDKNKMKLKFSYVQLNFPNYKKVNICIPDGEHFRLKNIFTRKCYDFRSLTGLSEKPMIWDIGANVGLFSIFAKSISHDCIIHCFEPSQRSLPLLSNNLAEFENISIHPLALSNYDGKATFFHHPLNSGSDTLQFGEVKEWRITNDRLKTTEVNVKSAGKMWDALEIETIDLLKLDTEGSEVEIIRSLGRKILKIKYIFFEYHSEMDRREIDLLLSDFILFSADAKTINRGELKYVNRNLIQSNHLISK